MSGKSGIMGTLLPWRARECEPMTGVWGQSPTRVHGHSPWSGVQGSNPPEAERILASGHPLEAANLPDSLLCVPQTQ